MVDKHEAGLELTLLSPVRFTTVRFLEATHMFPVEEGRILLQGQAVDMDLSGETLTDLSEENK